MKKDILIIDDEEDIRLLLSGILQDEGYETRVASDLNSMKLELIKRTPSLILLDVWLNKGSADGIDILKVIKKSYNNVPVSSSTGNVKSFIHDGNGNFFQPGGVILLESSHIAKYTKTLEIEFLTSGTGDTQKYHLLGTLDSSAT